MPQAPLLTMLFRSMVPVKDGYTWIPSKRLPNTALPTNVTPSNIEQAIKNEDPLISQVHAHGDKHPYISALVAPSPIETLEWGVEKGAIDAGEAKLRIAELMANPAARSAALEAAMAKIVGHAELTERVRAAVRRGNEKLAQVEKVKRFRVLDRDFSQEHGELTPTMKLKRKEVETKYAEVLARIYDDDGFALET